MISAPCLDRKCNSHLNISQQNLYRFSKKAIGSINSIESRNLERPTLMIMAVLWNRPLLAWFDQLVGLGSVGRSGFASPCMGWSAGKLSEAARVSSSTIADNLIVYWSDYLIVQEQERELRRQKELLFDERRRFDEQRLSLACPECGHRLRDTSGSRAGQQTVEAERPYDSPTSEFVRSGSIRSVLKHHAKLLEKFIDDRKW